LRGLLRRRRLPNRQGGAEKSQSNSVGEHEDHRWARRNS
jgi:hypothetical protein